jgi:uncharacterized protein YegP (UPF0339 family)
MSRTNRVVLTTLFTWSLIGGASLLLHTPTAPAAEGDEKVQAKFEVYRDKGGEFRWRLRATNSQILATSGDGYAAKRDCLHAIDSVKRAAANAPVEDMAETRAQGKDVGQGKGDGRAGGDASGAGGGATNAQRKK